MKLRTLTAALAAVTLALTSLSAYAADPKPAPIMRASVSSLDDVKKLIADLAIPLPFPLDPKAMIERQFKFVGPGGLQGDKPIGMVFIGGDNLRPQEQAVFLFPVIPTAATLDSLTSTGATAVDGHADMVSMANPQGTVNFRRTAEYLLWYPGTVDLLAGVDVATITRDYAKPGHLATVSLDLAAFRTAAPEKYKAFWEQVRRPQSNDPAQLAGQKMAQDAMQNFADKLDRLTFAVGRDDNAVHLEAWAMPLEFKEPHKFPRPAFPAGIVAQMHNVYSNGSAATYANTFLDKLPTDKFGNGKFTPEQTQRFMALAHRVAGLAFGADAQSFAVEIASGAPIVYVVNQYTADTDAPKELAAIVKDFNALGGDSGEGDVLTLSTYQSAAGKSVSRVAILDHRGGVTKAYVDLIQQGKVVTIAIAPEDGKHVEAVAALPAAGEISALCSGSIDLANALKSAEASGAPLPLPEPQLAQLRQAFAGQAITWVVKGNAKGKYLYTSLDIPTALIKQGGQMFVGMMQTRGPNRMGPGGPPPMGPGGPGGPPGGMP